MVYLDNAATTRPHPEVLAQLQNSYAGCFGNPSSIHPAGKEASEMLNQARRTLSEIFNVPLAGIVFCGSGTESDNLALKGFFTGQRNQQSRVIISPLEHAAVAKTCQWLEKNELAAVDIVKVEKQTGQVDLSHLATLVTRDTKMISIQHVNSETGVIQNLAAITKTARAINPDILIHSDGVQAFSRIPVNLNELGLDLYSISAHKFHGIKGTGALILNRKLALEPLIHGGGQEHGLRSGTENIAGTAAMAHAASIAIRDFEENRRAVELFARQFRQSIKEQFPEAQISSPIDAVPHIISVYFPGIFGEVLLHHLARQKIFVSTGSACNATSKKLSSVLQTMGYSQERIRGTVRISLAASEIPKERELFFKRFNSAVSELQNMTG